MEKTPLNETMQAASQDAIVFAQEIMGFTLDKSLDSLYLIDALLLQLKEQHLLKNFTAAELFTLSSIFGAYVGELFIKHRAGEWFYDESKAEEPYTAVKVQDKDFPFASICYHQIVNKPQMSLSAYFEKASDGIRQ